MYFLAKFIEAFATVLGMALDIYMWLIIGRALISWVNPDPYNPIVQFLHRATEPVMRKVRKILPYGGFGGIDVSPIIVIMAIVFLRILVVDSMMRLAFMLTQQ